VRLTQSRDWAFPPINSGQPPKAGPFHRARDMHAKSRFAQLLDGAPGNKFDARQVLAKRRERRRELIPFVPIQNFGLTVDEARNELRPARLEQGADSAGAEIWKLRN
jgi:hypothetical protein